MKKSLALALSAVALMASVPVGLKDELERKVLAMGSACAAMEGAWNHRLGEWTIRDVELLMG